MRAAHLALSYRHRFASDVVVDLIGYRRHGHSEVDDPTITQPQLYAEIKSRPPLWESYAERLGLADSAKELAASVRAELEAAKAAAEELTRIPRLYTLPEATRVFVGHDYRGAVQSQLAQVSLSSSVLGSRYPMKQGVSYSGCDDLGQGVTEAAGLHRRQTLQRRITHHRGFLLWSFVFARSFLSSSSNDWRIDLASSSSASPSEYHSARRGSGGVTPVFCSSSSAAPW